MGDSCHTRAETNARHSSSCSPLKLSSSLSSDSTFHSSTELLCSLCNLHFLGHAAMRHHAHRTKLVPESSNRSAGRESVLAYRPLALRSTLCTSKLFQRQ